MEQQIAIESAIKTVAAVAHPFNRPWYKSARDVIQTHNFRDREIDHEIPAMFVVCLS